jgi:hypothetical protein
MHWTTKHVCDAPSDHSCVHCTAAKYLYMYETLFLSLSSEFCQFLSLIPCRWILADAYDRTESVETCSERVAGLFGLSFFFVCHRARRCQDDNRLKA